MGQAKQRGTFEQRRAEAIAERARQDAERRARQPEVIVTGGQRAGRRIVRTLLAAGIIAAQTFPGNSAR